MEKHLIGSNLLKYWFPDEYKRTPKDIDYLVEDASIFPKEKGVEYMENPVLLDYIRWTGGLDESAYKSLKMSHIFWDTGWSKHIYDIQFMNDMNIKYNRELFYDLFGYWWEFHGAIHRSDLDMSADQFFNNASDLTYDHDQLHLILKDPPTYTKVLKDGAEVDVDEDKFLALSFEEKCDLVREEVYVMAYERKGKRDWYQAYTWMLKKFIQLHAPLWESVFILENYTELSKPTINYFKVLENGINQINI